MILHILFTKIAKTPAIAAATLVVVEELAVTKGEEINHKACDSSRVGSNDFGKKKKISHLSPPSMSHMLCG